MGYIAHSENNKGLEHQLNAHLSCVASLMGEIGASIGYQDIFSITGILHDLGKYQPEFQHYLKYGGRRGSVPHASWGAAFAKHWKQNEVAFAIDGHHKGMPDMKDLQSDMYDFDEPNHPLFSSLKSEFLNEVKIDETSLKYADTGLRGTDKELFIRILFSALTDADWLDTEAHFDDSIADHRKTNVFDANILLQLLESELKGKSKDGNINILRNKVREYAISMAYKQSGFYSMPLPTGMGKTLASVSWALHHAKHNNHKRIIIVLPFISIIDQTAKELKRIFGEEWVLEHHSNFNEDENANKEIANESLSDDAYRRRLATENWDYPIIVTTAVQFFESLFGNKPSRCRKVHNIAQSCVIFDEVQTLPKELVLPTLTMLKNMQKVAGTSFLFCTATLPAFETREKFNGIDSILSLVADPKAIFDATRRVDYRAIDQYQSISIGRLSEIVVERGDSALCIFNTKKQALLFFNEIENAWGFRVFHLSTSMYPAHRKQVIADIRTCLLNNENIIVSSTQLIEAGVDFDFPSVYREIAPLESIIQSAGRCNREGKMPMYGQVYIFALEDASAPNKQYRAMAEFANSLYCGNELLLHEHDFYKEYYRKSIDLFVDADKKSIDADRIGFNFKTVAGKYRLIENNTTPLFILCDSSAELYESIRHKPVLSKADYRAMQQYTVQVYDNFMKENVGKMGLEPQGYWKWNGEYHPNYGLSQKPEMSTLII